MSWLWGPARGWRPRARSSRRRDGMVEDETVDVVFTLYCATLVFSMQIGFTLLEVGSVSIRNTKNILLKNLLLALEIIASYGIIL